MFVAGEWVRLVLDITYHPNTVATIPRGAVGKVIGLVPGTENEEVYRAEWRYTVKFEGMARPYFEVHAYYLEPISLLEVIAEVAR